jgi:hypothetical protein
MFCTPFVENLDDTDFSGKRIPAFMARIADLQGSKANTRGASLRWREQLQLGVSFASLTWGKPHTP